MQSNKIISGGGRQKAKEKDAAPPQKKQTAYAANENQEMI
jgi:hypothetical protein